MALVLVLVLVHTAGNGTGMRIGVGIGIGVGDGVGICIRIGILKHLGAAAGTIWEHRNSELRASGNICATWGQKITHF